MEGGGGRWGSRLVRAMAYAVLALLGVIAYFT
jgi:hypothetical protein